MKAIVLTQGQKALVDDEDYARVSQFKWCAQKSTQRGKIVYYAKRAYISEGGKHTTVLLHRFIMNAKPGLWVDHRNRNPLDCRKENLRYATPSQNRANSCIRVGNSTGYKGVQRESKSGRYFVRTRFNGRDIRFGSYATALQAALAYDQKARELWGEFANTNFPVYG